MDDKRFLPVIIFAVGIILTLGWYELIYTPAQIEILNMELETRRLREVEREILELKARHENLAAFVEEKELQRDAAQNFLPPTLAQDRFIDELYRAAESLDVKIISIRAEETTSTEKLQAQVVSVNLEADYISLMNFIREIVDGERLTTLDEISVEHLSGKVLSCDLDFKIFATAP
mgnify:CR=1 FL=1